MGEAIYKVITIAEIVKYRVPGLHQINEISRHEFRDTYYPLEEGLDKLVFKRRVATLTITLIKQDQLEKEKVDTEFFGFQEMVPQHEVDPKLELPGPQNKRYFSQAQQKFTWKHPIQQKSD
mmetsp:Transcript_14102/g.23950  ORF Transcript_14102/g.23950 Transcript_14102/m.23950 type:complete len:121 (+) Transcript_14102:146-508(+)